MSDIPRPILKWPGGKTGSLDQILSALPEKIGTYYEPFFGGGAVFFALARANRFERAVISDSNGELVHLLRTIRDNLDGVSKAIMRLGTECITEEKYYQVRDSKPRTAAGKAARTLFLNKTGFNGLYRVNRDGEFNVPWGKHESWDPDWTNLCAVSELLKRKSVVIHNADFAYTLRQCELFDKSAVYLDPPYFPASPTANFTAYRPGGFSRADQERVANLFAKLAYSGVHVVASNAAVPEVLELYEGILGTKIIELKCRRSVNRDGAKRGTVGEYLIVNRGLR